MSWELVEIAQKEKRREIIISGQWFSEQIEKYGLDPGIFKLLNLNFLQIKNTCLGELSPDIGSLINLTHLDVSHNKLQSLPAEIGALKKMKFFNVSQNEISSVPSQLSELVDLQSINVSFNKLESLPPLNKLCHLVTLDICHNKFASIPASVCDPALIHFTNLNANNNLIEEIVPEVENAHTLKVLNLGDNCIVSVCGEVGGCSKLKELNLKGNKLKDNRLKKMVEQCHDKQVLEYIRSHCPRVNADNNKQGKSKKKTKSKKTDIEEVVEAMNELKIRHAGDDDFQVVSMPNVSEIRPYIVCCRVLDTDLSDATLFKDFITLQTKLHKSICEERTIATIATHDFSKIEGKVFYNARSPMGIKIHPLNRKKEVTAAELYTHLNEEADAVRKEKKKSTYSGIHKYLYLLKDKTLYPCLSDSSGCVISFPPITNSDVTRISPETKSILLEVTGNKLNDCKKVMDCLLKQMLHLGIGKKPEDEDDTEEPKKYLTVQQIKIVDEEGKMKVVYPSRTDLDDESISVIRV